MLKHKISETKFARLGKQNRKRFKRQKQQIRNPINVQKLTIRNWKFIHFNQNRRLNEKCKLLLPLGNDYLKLLLFD